MKASGLLKHKYGIWFLTLLVCSCVSRDVIDPQETEEVTESSMEALIVPDNFAWKTTQEIGITITSFSAKSLHSHKHISIYSDYPNTNGKLILEGSVIGEEGFKDSISVPTYYNKLVVGYKSISGEYNLLEMPIRNGLAHINLTDMFYEENQNTSGLYKSAPMVVADSDGDGVPDADDVAPNDKTIAHKSYFPYKNGAASIVFEDLWPSKGDFDLNDLVLHVSGEIYTNANNRVKKIDFVFDVKAVGAAFKNGFGFQIDKLMASKIKEVTGTLNHTGSFSRASNGVEVGQSKAVIIVADDFEPVIERGNGSVFFNTIKEHGYYESTKVKVSVVFRGTQKMSKVSPTNYNWFIVPNRKRDVEVHMADFVPTSLASAKYFGSMHDASKPAQNTYYKTKNNLPWGIFFLEPFDWVVEFEDITKAYPKIIEWAESGGEQYKDWYLDGPGYRKKEFIFNE